MRTILALAALATAVLVAGCGGGMLSKAQYEQRIQTDGKAVQAAIQSIDAGTTSLPSLATQVSAAEAAVKKSADDLESLKAPKDAAADNVKIVAGLRAIGRGLEALKRAARKGNAAAAHAAAISVTRAPEIREAQRASTDLRKKGYSIGVIGA
ncbi:MAG: hypothetical protein ACYDCH_10105 [Gaiellaceae bacterium]